MRQSFVGYHSFIHIHLTVRSAAFGVTTFGPALAAWIALSITGALVRAALDVDLPCHGSATCGAVWADLSLGVASTPVLGQGQVGLSDCGPPKYVRLCVFTGSPVQPKTNLI